MAESLYQESIQLTGLPGATAQSRYVGATVSGYPTSGSFVTGDFIIDQSGTTWVCTSGGSPGTWLNPLNKVTNSVASAYYTSQTAQLGPINLYTAPASGFYQLNYYAKVTSTGTTSTLGPITVTSTDIDGTSITNYGDATSANTVASGFINGMIPLLVGSGTTISYTIPYTSSGSPMGYEAYVNLTSTNLTQNASPVISFNGRTGAVIPGSSDYTAAQVGALPIATTVAAKNVLINGNMDIWQRGTTGFTTGYTADRWLIGGTQTVSQSTDVPYSGAKYSMDTVSTGANYNIIKQRIESFNSETLIAGTATISFWAKSLSGTNTLNVAFYYATAVDNFASQTYINTVGFGVPSTSWTFYSGQVTLPSAALSNGIEIQIYRDNSVANEFKLSQVQFENGSTATAFSRAGGTIQGELAACQRYFYQVVAPGGTFLNGDISGGYALGVYKFPVTMRTAPSVTATAVTIYSGSANSVFSTFAGNTSTEGFRTLYLPSGMTSGYAFHADNNGTILISAEL